MSAMKKKASTSTDVHRKFNHSHIVSCMKNWKRCEVVSLRDVSAFLFTLTFLRWRCNKYTTYIYTHTTHHTQML